MTLSYINPKDFILYQQGEQEVTKLCHSVYVASLGQWAVRVRMEGGSCR